MVNMPCSCDNQKCLQILLTISCQQHHARWRSTSIDETWRVDEIVIDRVVGPVVEVEDPVRDWELSIKIGIK